MAVCAPSHIGGNQKRSLQSKNVDVISLETVFLSPGGRQMAIKNSVSNDFLSTFINSINVFDCHLSGVSLEAACCS